MGHSQGKGGHHHHHDNTYLTSANRNDPGVRITRIGLYVNLGMAVVKGAGGYVFNSKALMADAVHALTDLVSDLATLATISYSLRPVSARFPLGYGKIESLGALAVSGLLLSGGIMIGLHAIMALSQQFSPEIAHMLSHIGLFEHAHSHSHSHVHGDPSVLGPSMQAAWLAGGSIVVKEWLYRATMKVAQQKRSSVLASNAYHHRVDSLTGFVALLTICASGIFEGAQWLDPVGGLIISGMVVQAGYVNMRSALLELSDVGIEDEIREQVESTARKVLAEHVGGGEQEISLRGVQGIKSGQNVLVEVEVAVPTGWTLAEMDVAETQLRERIGAAVRGVRRVSVRFSDAARADEVPFAREFIAREESDDPEGKHPHEHEHNHDHGHQHEHEHQHEGKHQHDSQPGMANGSATAVAGGSRRRK